MRRQSVLLAAAGLACATAVLGAGCAEPADPSATAWGEPVLASGAAVAHGITMATTTVMTAKPAPPAPPPAPVPAAPPAAGTITKAGPPPAPRTTTRTAAPACDPNYSGCVPVAFDVDCAGGSGNGPAYVRGPIRVIGTDIYDLDRDGDGIACQ
jgi:hypothetical protein